MKNEQKGMNEFVGDGGGECAMTGRISGASAVVSDRIFKIGKGSRTVSDQIFTFGNVPEGSGSRRYGCPEVRRSESDMSGGQVNLVYNCEEVRRSGGSEVRRSEGAPYVMIRGRIIVCKGGGV